MKIRMYFGAIKTIIISIVLAGTLAIVGLDIAMLVGTNGVKTSSPAIAAVSLAAAVIIAVAAMLILCNSYYRFDEDKLVIMLGFFRDKVGYDKVVAIKQNNVTKEVFVIYESVKEEEGNQSIRFNLAPQKTDVFLAQMRKYCPFVIVEPFTPEKKDRDKK